MEPRLNNQFVTRSSEPLLHERVESFTRRYQKDISNLVAELVEADGYVGLDKQRPLLSNLICAHSSRVIQIATSLAGFDANVYERRLPVKSPYRLQEVLPYGACVHKIVAISEGTERVIVDGAYLQFIKSISDTLPPEDILVTPLPNVQNIATKLASSNSVASFSGFVRIMPDQGPGNKNIGRPTVDIPIGDHSLSDYLTALWNINSGEFVLESNSRKIKTAVNNFLSKDYSMLEPELTEQVSAISAIILSAG